MSNERLEKLSEANARASELNKQIESLQAADPKIPGNNALFYNGLTNAEFLEKSELVEVIDAGRRLRIGILEKELRKILSIVNMPTKPAVAGTREGDPKSPSRPRSRRR